MAESFFGAPPSAGSGNKSAASFIPAVWSKKLLARYWAEAVAMGICNTDYEGEISGAGSKVIIRKSPLVGVQNYDPADPSKLLKYDMLKEEMNEMVIEHAKAWAFQTDDVLKVQSDIELVNSATTNAGDALVQFIDKHVLGTMPTGAATQLGTISNPLKITQGASTATEMNVLDMIIEEFSVACTEKNLPRQGRFIVLPSWMAAKLKLSELRNVSITGDGTSPLRNGQIGVIDNVAIHESNNLAQVDASGVHRGEDVNGNMPWEIGYDETNLAPFDAATARYKLIGGTKEYFSFATQYVKTETNRIPGRFGDAVQGLQVYGMKDLMGDAGVAMTCVKA